MIEFRAKWPIFIEVADQLTNGAHESRYPRPAASCRPRTRTGDVLELPHGTPRVIRLAEQRLLPVGRKRRNSADVPNGHVVPLRDWTEAMERLVVDSRIPDLGRVLPIRTDGTSRATIRRRPALQRVRGWRRRCDGSNYEVRGRGPLRRRIALMRARRRFSLTDFVLLRLLRSRPGVPWVA
jgi:hypothetical protein